MIIQTFEQTLLDIADIFFKEERQIEEETILYIRGSRTAVITYIALMYFTRKLSSHFIR